MGTNRNNQIPDFIKRQALNGKHVYKVTHKDGTVTYETRPPHYEVQHPLKSKNYLVEHRPRQQETTPQVVHKVKPKKKFKVKKLIPIVLIPIVIGTGCTPVYKYGVEPIEQYNQQNQIFDIDKVKEDLAFFGGDPRYVATNRPLYGLKNAELYTHFNLEEDRSIKVGFADNISDEYKQQFKHTFDYVNSIFHIINPDIRFELTDKNQDNCDIWIQGKALNEKVGMSIVTDRDKLTGSQLTGAVINVNSSIEMSTPQQRFYLIHELMHLLTGSSDVNYMESPTFSVYNYNDMGFIVDQVENAWESEEEKKEATNGKFATVRPILSAEEKDSWVTYLPTDIGTLIALYGDTSIESNKDAYIKLLNDTLADCSEKFGERQPYFVDGYVVPQNKPKQESTNNNNIENNNNNNTNNNNSYNDDLSY